MQAQPSGTGNPFQRVATQPSLNVAPCFCAGVLVSFRTVQMCPRARGAFPAAGPIARRKSISNVLLLDVGVFECRPHAAMPCWAWPGFAYRPGQRAEDTGCPQLGPSCMALDCVVW
eukprot:6316128-Alexandrium_andersonii.AAC.1